MKILYVTTIGGTMNFFKAFIKSLIDEGHTVDIATSEKERAVAPEYRAWGCRVFPIDWSRSVLNKGNLKAIRQVKTLVENGGYDIVHCHTPIAAALTRLACRKLRRKGVKVIYTAHGFHFYKGAPLLNWLIYYPVEKLCAPMTDVLVTINREDYVLAQKQMHAKRIEYVPGVGIDAERFANISVDRAAKRRELNIPEDVRLMLSVGELNDNKNHALVLRAMEIMQDQNLHYAVAGTGPSREKLMALAEELNIADQLHLLGYRTDVAELYKTVDLYVHPSFREGLPVALMEAMAAGLPCIASNIRGCADLLSGRTFAPDRAEQVAELLRAELSPEHLDESFTTRAVIRRMREIYHEA